MGEFTPLLFSLPTHIYILTNCNIIKNYLYDLLFAFDHVIIYTTMEFAMVGSGYMDWYDAIVIANSLLGSTFQVTETCVFRRCETESRQFEICNLKDTVVVLTGDEAKTQLRSSRDRNNEVVRSRDQGFINWKYSSIVGDDDDA